MTGIIRKPWGREYCAYRNEHVAIWVLEIRKGEATSLHAHPGKSTALVLLRGAARLELLRGDPISWYGLSKINIFHGRFHRTRSLADNTVLLEIESPDDKRNIVRLDDAYGRECRPIEDATESLISECLCLSGEGPAIHFAGCSLWTFVPMSQEELVWRSDAHDSILVTLRGGLEHGLVPPGEAIDSQSMARLASKFPPVPSAVFLQIRRITV